MDPGTHDVCQVDATAGETDFCATPVAVSVQGDEVHEMACASQREDEQCRVRQQAPWSPTEASSSRHGTSPPVVDPGTHSVCHSEAAGGGGPGTLEISAGVHALASESEGEVAERVLHGVLQPLVADILK